MKSYNIILAAFLICLSFIACDEDEPYFVAPKAGLELNKDHGMILESIVFYNNSEGQNFSIYPGDQGHVYGVPGNTGIPFEGDTLRYSYLETGTFKVTMVANGIKLENKEVVTDTISKFIVIRDTVSRIERIEFTADGQFFFQGGIRRNYYYEGVPNDKNNIICPVFHHSHFLDEVTEDYVNSINDLRLKAFISQNYGVEVQFEVQDVEDFTNGGVVKGTNAEGNAFEPKTYSIESNDGLYQRNYLVSFMTIPEFTSLRLDGRNCVIQGSNKDYQKFTAELTVADSIDITNMVAEFTIRDEAIEVEIDGVAQESGVTTNDFTEPVVYTLTYRQPGYEDDFIITSEVTVTVSREENE